MIFGLQLMIVSRLFIVRVMDVCKHINGLKLMVKMLFQRLLPLVDKMLMEFSSSGITARQCYIKRRSARSATSKGGRLKQYTCQDIELPTEMIVNRNGSRTRWVASVGIPYKTRLLFVLLLTRW